MKRLIIVLGLVLSVGLLVPPTFAQVSPSVSVCPGIRNPILPKGFQQLSAGGTAVALTVPSASQMAVVTVEVASIRWRDDGTSPTATVGVFVASAGTTVLCGNSVLNAWKAIATSGTATLGISYYGQ